MHAKNEMHNTYTTIVNTTHNMAYQGCPHMQSNSIHRIQHVVLHSNQKKLTFTPSIPLIICIKRIKFKLCHQIYFREHMC